MVISHIGLPRTEGISQDMTPSVSKPTKSRVKRGQIDHSQ